MASARLKMLILRAHITVSVMTIALMQMKHGYMEIGFIQQLTLGNRKISTRQSYPIDHYTVKRFYKKGIEKISRSVEAYIYLVLTSQV